MPAQARAWAARVSASMTQWSTIMTRGRPGFPLAANDERYSCKCSASSS